MFDPGAQAHEMNRHGQAVPTDDIGGVLSRVAVDEVLHRGDPLDALEIGFPVLQRAAPLPAPRRRQHVEVCGTVQLLDRSPAPETARTARHSHDRTQ